MRKLSRPWHGPYRVIDKRDPDIAVVKVYTSQDGPIQVHQSRVVWCPPELPARFYCYGSRRSTPGRPPGTIPPTAPEPQNSTDAGVGTQSSPDNTEDRNEPESENAESGPDGDVPQDPTTDPDVGQDETKDSTSDSTGDGDQDESPDEDLAVTGNTTQTPHEESTKNNHPPPRKKRTSTSIEEIPTERSQRRTGLRTKTTPPTRLMTFKMTLKDEPP